jgi:hypothetical protein
VMALTQLLLPHRLHARLSAPDVASEFRPDL